MTDRLHRSHVLAEGYQFGDAGRLALCTCTLITGGHRVLSSACPIHAVAAEPPVIPLRPLIGDAIL